MVSPYSIEGNMGPLGIGPQGGGMGRGQSNWLADALAWQIPGTQNIPRLPARNIPRIGGHIDTAGRWLIPGVETQRMAEQGASPGALGGSLAMDTLPVGMVAGKVGRTLRGALPSGVSNVIKYPFQQASRAGDWMNNTPRLFPLRLDYLPTRPGMEREINKWDDWTSSTPLAPNAPERQITDNPITPYVPSRNWMTGMEEPGISTFQALRFPRGGFFDSAGTSGGPPMPKFPSLLEMLRGGKPYIVPSWRGITDKSTIDMLYDIGNKNNPGDRGGWGGLFGEAYGSGKKLFEVDADFIPGVKGSDLEALLDPASVRGTKEVVDPFVRPYPNARMIGREILAPSTVPYGMPTQKDIRNLLKRWTDTGQLINPPWYLRPEGIPMSIPTSAFAAAIPAARAGQISQE